VTPKIFSMYFYLCFCNNTNAVPLPPFIGLQYKYNPKLAKLMHTLKFSISWVSPPSLSLSLPLAHACTHTHTPPVQSFPATTTQIAPTEITVTSLSRFVSVKRMNLGGGNWVDGGGLFLNVSNLKCTPNCCGIHYLST
jgi:hypothetical protein